MLDLLFSNKGPSFLLLITILYRICVRHFSWPKKHHVVNLLLSHPWFTNSAWHVFVEKFLVTPDAGGYHFVNQGSLTVDNLDDREEIQITDVSMTLQG